MPEQILFLSDFHMGAGRNLESEGHPYEWLTRKMADTCADFLASVIPDTNIRSFILLGDIFDNNVCPIDQEPPSFIEIIGANKNVKLINNLKSLAASGKLHYVRRNHDMTINSEDLAVAFPGINISTSDIYEEGGLIALHGHQHFMWCAKDERDDNAFKPFPPGYFLSRIGATRQNRHCDKGIDTFAELAKIVIRAFNNNPHNIVELAFNAALAWAKIDPTEKLILDGNWYSFNDIKNNYAGLYNYWRENHRHEFPGNYLLTGNMTAIRWNYADIGRKTLVINGHSHEQSIGRCRELNPDAGPAYADCGSWCEDKPSFVRVIHDADSHRNKAVLEFWHPNDGTISHPGEAESASSDPRP